jgi:hypothetical protein
MNRKVFPFAVLLLALSDSAAARQEAHVHGVAMLNVAVESGLLEMEFVTPAGNLIGFEHAPVSEKERKAVQEANEFLEKGSELFRLPAAARCSLQVADVEFGKEPGHRADAGAADGEHDHGHEPDDHDHGHSHAEHDVGEGATDAEDGDEHTTEAKVVHADFRAYYRFGCEGSAVRTIELSHFERWPRIETIRLQALTPTRQFGGQIEADDAVIRFE